MVHAHFLVKCYDTLEPNCMWACGGLSLLESVKAGSCKLLRLPCDCGRNTFNARWNGCSKLFQKAKFGVTPAIPSFTMESFGLCIIYFFSWYNPLFGSWATCETPCAIGVYRIAFFFFNFPLTTQPFIQMYLISLQWHSSLNSQSSRIWWPGARKVQVAVRQTWQM